MSKTTIRLIVLLNTLAILSACKGQPQTGKADQNLSTPHAGKIVSELDKAIWSIYQDNNGHYWFGSNGNGVFYYNGKNLIQFTKGNGLAGHQIRGIQGDKHGNVYFDTPDGISKYDGYTFSTLKPIYSAENKWKSEPGDLWFKGSGDPNGVYRYDGDSLFHLTFPEQDLQAAFGMEFEARQYSPYGVYGIYKDKKGNLWFGMLSAGVYRYDGNSLFWIAEQELTVLEDGRVPGVRSIIEDKNGDFWLSNTLHRYRISTTENGKVSYQKLAGIAQSNAQPKMKFPYFMSAMIDDNNADLWLLTYKEGVWRYDGKTLFQYPIKAGETDVLLFAMYKDNQGTIWLGTHNAGVYKFNGSAFEQVEL